MNKRITRLLVFILIITAVLIALIFLITSAGQTNNNQDSLQFIRNQISPTTQILPTLSTTVTLRERIKIAYVIDGDTIIDTAGRKIRYIGINTPELGKDQQTDDCFAREAKEINTSLTSGQTAELEKDMSNTDKYGRLLRYVYIDGVFINDFLIRQGYARLDSVPPDTKFANDFKSAAAEAKINNRGLWKECGK